jgi:hypothetical protein
MLGNSIGRMAGIWRSHDRVCEEFDARTRLCSLYVVAKLGDGGSTIPELRVVYQWVKKGVVEFEGNIDELIM